MSAESGCVFIEFPGWREEVLSRPQARAVIEAYGEAALKSIEAHIPVNAGFYKASFDANAKAEATTAADGTAAVKLTAGDPRWHIIEFGSAVYSGVHNPAYAPIRRGLNALGIRFTNL